MSIHKNNLDDFDVVLGLCKKINVKLAVEIVTNCNESTSLTEIEKDEYKVLVKKLFNEKIDCNDPIYMLSGNKYSKYSSKDIIFGCSAGISAIYVDVDQNVFPCARIRIKLGNLKKDNLKQIWENSNILHMLSDRENLKGKCYSCDWIWACGGCRARAFNKYNDLLGEDYLCCLS